MNENRENNPAASEKWLTMLAVGMSVLMATLDMSIINLALPTLVTELNTDFPTIQWVILAYVLIVTSMMLGVARLGDMKGKKRVYGIGLAVFTCGSLLCGLAPSVGWLIAFRGLQGVGAVMTQALGAAIVTEVFPASERGRVLGIMGSIVSIGLALGPPLGGLLIGLTGWRSVFLINVPLGVFAIWVLHRHVPPSRPGRPGQRFDLPGAALLFVTLGGYALAMTLGQRLGFGQAIVLGLLALAAAGMAAFVLIERRTRMPMLNLNLFGNVLFSLNLVMSLLIFIVLGGMFIMPFFLQLVRGYSTQTVGLLMMVVPVIMGVTAPIAGSLSDRWGPRGISLAGLLVVVGGCLALSTLHKDVSAWGYILRMAPMGLGMGLFASPNNSAIMGAAPKDQLGVASGLMALSRTLGHTTGLPLMGAIFSAQIVALGGMGIVENITIAPPEVLVAGVTGTMRLAAVAVAASTVLAAVALRIDRRRKARKGS